MTAKEFLRQYGDCERRIQSRQRRIQRLKEQAESITQTLSERVQSSGGGDSQAKIIETYVDMERELEQEVLTFRDVQRKIEKVISAIKDKEQKALLINRYIHGDKWAEIITEMRYSERQIYRIHGKALETTEDILTILSHFYVSNKSDII